MNGSILLAIRQVTVRGSPARATMWYGPQHKALTMKEMLLRFSDDDTALERLASQAQGFGITPEEWVHRAIAFQLGAFGLQSVPEDFAPKSLQELFVATGILSFKGPAQAEPFALQKKKDSQPTQP